MAQLLNPIRFDNIKGDVFGGLTAAVIALPMALTFGVSAFGDYSDGGATAGLYGAIVIGLFASLFGGTPTLISEPTGPMFVVFAQIVTDLIGRSDGDATKGLAMAFTVVMMAGAMQVLFGFLKLGKYITQMPYTVISGFMSGIGIILMLLQLPTLLGSRNFDGEGVLGILTGLPGLITSAQIPVLVIGLVCIAILFLTPSQVKRVVPPQLLALVVATVFSLVFFSGVSIDRIPAIESALPTLTVPTFTGSDFRVMLVDAGVLAMLGSIDALLTSVVADSLTRTEHDSDKELIGQGIGNFVSGLVGGLPGAGATMGTVVNIQAGGRTILSGLCRAAILLVVVLGAAKLTEPIPMAVLSGIAFKVGLDIVDWDFLKRAHKLSWKAAMILYSVIILTVFVDLITAVGLGVFVANVLTINRLSKLRSDDVKAVTSADDEITLPAGEAELLNRAEGRVLLLSLSGPMIFGVAKAIGREHALVDKYQVLLLDLHEVSHIGVTASLALENALQEAVDAGRHVFVVGAGPKVLKRLGNLRVWKQIPPLNVLESREEALMRSLDLLDLPAQPSSAQLADVVVDVDPR